MARPEKHEYEKRSVQRNVRLTIFENEQLIDKAQAADVKPSDFLRNAFLDYKLFVSKRRIADPTLIRTIDRLGGEVRDLGNVTNQVALYCHTDRTHLDAWATLPEEIRSLMNRIEDTLDMLLLSEAENDP